MGDEIVASEVTEDHPNPATFVVEYHLADQPSAIWTPVAAMPGAVGTATIKPAPLSAVSVQLRVKDMAENEGKRHRRGSSGRRPRRPRRPRR